MTSNGSAGCSIAAARFITGICLKASAGTPGNFHLGIGQQDGDFASPRHRHNFDQFRFQLEGTMNFDRNGKMTAGTLGYFPGRRRIRPAKLGRAFGHRGAAIRRRQRQRLSVAEAKSPPAPRS